MAKRIRKIKGKMTKMKINQAQKELIEGKVLAFATCDLNNKPNVIAVTSAKVIGEDQILLTDNYMNKTKQNLTQNPQAALVVWSEDEEEGYQFKGIVEYLIEGKWKKFFDCRRRLNGLNHQNSSENCFLNLL